MQAEWVSHIEDCPEIKMKNIETSHIFIEFVWPIQFSKSFFKYDGLPLNCIWIGFFRIGWGKTHEWIDA